MGSPILQPTTTALHRRGCSVKTKNVHFFPSGSSHSFPSEGISFEIRNSARVEMLSSQKKGDIQVGKNHTFFCAK